MIIFYEITATVREDLIADFKRYLIKLHIPDLMATGSFLAATLARSEPGRYRIRYEAKDRKSLDDYLRYHAPRLREHMIRTFPEGIELSREEWDVIATFDR